MHKNNSLARKLKLKKYIVVFLVGLYPWTFVVEGHLFRPNTEAGGFLGTSYYLGDINSRRQFYAPGISVGGLLKHNFTEHHILRAGAYLGKLKGNDLDFRNEYQQMRANSFDCTVLDCSVGYEFNFSPYVINRFEKKHSTFIFASVGYSLKLSSSTGIASNHVTIPFGVGYKYRLSKIVTIGCEWGMRKAFSDKIDGIVKPGDSSLLHNNDWYSFAGIFMTFRVFEARAVCPGIPTKERRYR